MTDKDEIGISIPTINYKDVIQLAKNMNLLTEEEVERLTPEKRKALRLAAAAIENTPTNGANSERVDETWSVGIPKDDGGVIRTRELGVDSGRIKGVITGKAATMKMYDFLGINNNVQIVLYNSGFKIELGNISESKIIGLIVRLEREKLELGKNTHGLIFSADSFLYVEILIDFVVDNMASSTLNIGDGDIREYIKLTDIDEIARGVMQAMVPHGVTISRVCSNIIGDGTLDDVVSETCSNVFTMKLDLSEITHVDKSKLTDYHIGVLSKSTPNSVTITEVEYYQSTLSVLNENNSIIVANGRIMDLVLAVPNVLTDVRAGNIWISNIIASSEEMLAKLDDSSDDRKLRIFEDLSKVTLLNRYLHYIKEIRIDDAIMSDAETISNMLNIIISSEAAHIKVKKALYDFAERKTITVLGLPQYVCTKCNKSKDILDGVFKEVIPINIFSVFTQACFRRLGEMREQ